VIGLIAVAWCSMTEGHYVFIWPAREESQIACYVDDAPRMPLRKESHSGTNDTANKPIVPYACTWQPDTHELLCPKRVGRL
jgi:hypothetical protein